MLKNKLEDDDKERREEERKTRQVNVAGQTTMISPLARMLAASVRKTTKKQTRGAKAFVDSAIAADAVVVFGKMTCPRCQQATELLSQLQSSLLLENQIDETAKVNIIDLEIIPTSKSFHMSAVQDYLWDLTGCRTVPRVFVDGLCIGGYDDMRLLHEEGSLSSKVTEAFLHRSRVSSVIEEELKDDTRTVGERSDHSTLI